ncbi:MAG: hypothetical protein ACI4VP_00040, partial [Clostridia bacterium]
MNKDMKNQKINKIIIMLLIVLMFNFIMPNYCHAGLLINAFSKLCLTIPDLLIAGLQDIFIGDSSIENEDGTYSIKFAPGTIFAGKIPLFDINFISPMESIKIIDEKYYTEESDIHYYEGETVGYAHIVKFAVENGIVTKPDGWNPDNPDSYDDWGDSTGISLVGEDACNVLTPKYEKKYASNSDDTKTETYYVNAPNGASLKVVYYFQVIDTYREWGYNTQNSPERYLYQRYKYEMWEENVPGVETKEIPSISKQLKNIIASWYKVMQEIALVGLLSVLVYIAIRIIMSSAAQEKAKYKKMLADWFAAICIVFVLHFIISFAFTVTQSITDVFAKSVVGDEGEDKLMTDLRNEIGPNNDDDFWDTAFNIIMYLVLFIYTISFAIQYLKRVVYVAFLIMIAPLIALTYPLDKIKDGKAQAFEVWLKEFLFNVLLQPIHLLIYFMLITSAMDLATNNKIYALVAIGSLLPVEKFIRKMFGLETSTSMGKMASAMGGAAIMNAINKLG